MSIKIKDISLFSGVYKEFGIQLQTIFVTKENEIVNYNLKKDEINDIVSIDNNDFVNRFHWINEPFYKEKLRIKAQSFTGEKADKLIYLIVVYEQKEIISISDANWDSELPFFDEL